MPNPKVEFTGRPRRDTVWEAERTNLPAQVQPGVTYCDIGAGTVVNQRTVGNVSSLSVLRETTGAGGQILRQVRDTSGAVIELTLDAAGKVINSRVISQATGTSPRP